MKIVQKATETSDVAKVGGHIPEIITLLFGSLISISVGVIVSNQFGSPYQYIIGLLGECITIIVSATWLIHSVLNFELRRLSTDVEDQSLLSAATEMVRKIDFPAFKGRLDEVRQELHDISNGYYSLQTLAAVYHDDIISIDSMEKDEVLRSMCPIGNDTEAASKQFTNKSFLASMDAHYRAIKRGVKVHRIYIFESKRSFDELQLCQEHLAVAAKNGIVVQAIFLDDPDFGHAVELPHDFVVFGQHKVSIGRVGPNSRVSGADVRADADTVRHYILEYQRMQHLGVEVGEISDPKK